MTKYGKYIIEKLGMSDSKYLEKITALYIATATIQGLSHEGSKIERKLLEKGFKDDKRSPHRCYVTREAADLLVFEQEERESFEHRLVSYIGDRAIYLDELIDDIIDGDIGFKLKHMILDLSDNNEFIESIIECIKKYNESVPKLT